MPQPLVAGFLNYSKLEAPAMEVSPQPVDTQDLDRKMLRLGSLLVKQGFDQVRVG